MKFSMLAMVDEETRKHIRELILGEAKAFVREQVNQAVSSELARVIRHHVEKFANEWRLGALVQAAIAQSMERREGEVEKTIVQAIKKAADKEVAKKLKNKTVWLAKDQDNYIRDIVRQEIHNMWADRMVKD